MVRPSAPWLDLGGRGGIVWGSGGREPVQRASGLATGMDVVLVAENEALDEELHGSIAASGAPGATLDGLGAPPPVERGSIQPADTALSKRRAGVCLANRRRAACGVGRHCRRASAQGVAMVCRGRGEELGR